jgi:hypothetical protein
LPTAAVTGVDEAKAANCSGPPAPRFAMITGGALAAAAAVFAFTR